MRFVRHVFFFFLLGRIDFFRRVVVNRRGDRFQRTQRLAETNRITGFEVEREIIRRFEDENDRRT